MTKIVFAVNGSEDASPEEIDLIQELIDGNVSFFSSIQEMLDDPDDFSECVVFIGEISDFGTVKNNPKFISTKVEKKTVKVSKK